MRKKLIKEALGVRPELVGLAKSLYSDIISVLLKSKNESIKSIDRKEIPIKLKGNIFNLNLINIVFNIHIRDHDDSISLFGFSASIKRSLENHRFIYDQTTDAELKIELESNSNNRIIDLVKYLESNQELVIPTLAHELKHFFDYRARKSAHSKENIQYQTYNSLSREQNPVSKIIGDAWYRTSLVEVLVTPTEVYVGLRNNKVTKEKFLKALNNNRAFIRYKNIANDFHYDIIYGKIYNTVSNEMRDSDYKELFLEESKKYVQGGIYDHNQLILFTIDFLFYKTRKNYYNIIKNKIVSNYQGSNFYRDMLNSLGIFPPDEDITDPEAQLLYNKISKNNSYAEPEFSLKDSPAKNKVFFTREINKIRENANNILRKLYRLYSLLPDKNTPRVSGSYKKAK